MRTNIFLKEDTVFTDILEDYVRNGFGLFKAHSNGTDLKNNLNLFFNRTDSSFLYSDMRESRLIPFSTCNLKVEDHIIDLTPKNGKYCIFELDDGPFTDIDKFVNDDVSIRIVIPTEFNHRNSWYFSHRVTYGDTFEAIRSDIYNQIINSSLREHFDIEMGADDVNIRFYINEDHNTIKVMPVDSMPQSAINFAKANNLISNKSREFINKLIIDADANYGFDYINCPDGDFYPNKLRYKDIEKELMKYSKNSSNGIPPRIDRTSKTIGLTHITFTEPRIVETTGDVVKQVINIIHPLNGEYFNVSNYNLFLKLLDSLSNPSTEGE